MFVCVCLTSEAYEFEVQPPAYTISDVCERVLGPETTHTDQNWHTYTCIMVMCAVSIYR